MSLGWLWLIANAYQGIEKTRERDKKVAGLEKRLADTRDSKEKDKLKYEIDKLRKEPIVCDAGANILHSYDKVVKQEEKYHPKAK